MIRKRVYAAFLLYAIFFCTEGKCLQSMLIGGFSFHFTNLPRISINNRRLATSIGFESPLSRVSYCSASTRLYPHRFNGGYDPSSPLTWTPQQAAEFTIFHHGSPEYIGMQLRSTIQHWSGKDLAEFLTRLYLGQPLAEQQTQIGQQTSSTSSPWSSFVVTHNHRGDRQENTKKLRYEPNNVRTPQWKGLDSREGILALQSLLKEALSYDVLDPQEIARFAEAFLLKEYKWPKQGMEQTQTSTNNMTYSKQEKKDQKLMILFEQDSFYSRGHAKTLARVLWSVRKHQASRVFTWDDIVMMVTLPEKEDKENVPMKMADFFQTMIARTPLTAKDKADMVQRLALGGWNPSSIPKFMSKILPSEVMDEKHAVSADGFLEDTFMDFPSESNADSGKHHNSENQAENKGNFLPIESLEEQFLLASEIKSARDSVRSEYEELVQAYWKQVNIPKTNSELSPISFELSRNVSVSTADTTAATVK